MQHIYDKREVKTSTLVVHESQSHGASTTRKEGDAHHTAGRYADGLQCWMSVLADEPNHPHGLAGMASALVNLDRLDEALPFVRRVTVADTFHPPSLARLGADLLNVRRHAEAIEILQHGTRNAPTAPDLWGHLGTAQLAGHRLSDAIQSFRRTILLQPTSAAPHCNMALALYGLNRLPEAVAASRRALAIEPASPVALFNLGCILLAMGRMQEGWAHYRLRFAAKTPTQRHDAQPWIGEPLAGKSIIVLGEQTNGDYIQFIRYATELAELGADITMTVPKRLHRLFSTLPCRVTFADVVKSGRGYDYQCPLFDLPHYLGLMGRDLPGHTPYLSAEPDRVARWRQRIGARGFRIAVAWEGSRYKGNDHNRSFPLEALWPVARVPGVRLVSLQWRSGVDQIAKLPPGMTVETLDDDFESEEHGFLDAAAVMHCVDLVITLDSALAHLAGALGCRTWIALNDAPEWRWQRDRTDSPWYPTALLFSQNKPGDWDGVFTRMAEALRDILPAATSDQAQLAKSLPLAPVSCGEILDKITILEIKSHRLTSPEALADVGRELRHLRSVAESFHKIGVDVEADVDRLRSVNAQLWDVEEALRSCEAKGRFGKNFTALARSVYKLNDQRAAFKRTINAALNSELIEHKSYLGGEPATDGPSS